MYEEDDFIPISALQHFVFCPRQWALIHLEGQWIENRFTAEGKVLHERSDEGRAESRGDLRIVRGLALCSRKLGLTGKADVVEFHRTPDAGPGIGAVLGGLSGTWKPFPVEYKRGRAKPNDCDTVQVCAQAMCLEEMLNVRIPEGAIFYGKPRRRLGVVFDDALRRRTQEVINGIRERLRDRKTPAAVYEKKCRSCSLLDVCMPKAAAGSSDARAYVQGILDEIGEDGLP